jgi:hypothetical protein
VVLYLEVGTRQRGERCPVATQNERRCVILEEVADRKRPCRTARGVRIASFPAHTVAHVKAAVDVGAFGSLAEGLLVEAHESDLSVASEVTQARVAVPAAERHLSGNREGVFPTYVPRPSMGNGGRQSDYEITRNDFRREKSRS